MKKGKVSEEEEMVWIKKERMVGKMMMWKEVWIMMLMMKKMW